jgi:hypothetical protein
MENASRAFLDAVRKSIRNIRTVIGATTISPELLTCAKRIQYEGYLHREETNAAVLALAKDGVPIKQIVRQTGHSRQLVRHVNSSADLCELIKNSCRIAGVHLRYSLAGAVYIDHLDGCHSSVHFPPRFARASCSGSQVGYFSEPKK